MDNQAQQPQDQVLEAGSCKREECRCLHEHGLVAIQNADGSVSQITIEQAKAQLESLKALEEQLK